MHYVKLFLISLTLFTFSGLVGAETLSETQKIVIANTCSNHFDVDRATAEAVECARIFFPEIPVFVLNYNRPRGCFVIPKEALAKVFWNQVYVWHAFTSKGPVPVVGIYRDDQQVILLAENIDIADNYKHEFIHHLLQVWGGDGNGAHDHPIWSVCSTPQYFPSSKVIDKVVEYIDSINHSKN